MFRRSLLALAMTLTLANFAAAQGNDGTPPNPNADGQATDVQELQRQIAALQTRIENLEADVARLPEVADKLDTVAGQLEGLDLQAMAINVRGLAAALEEIITRTPDGVDIDILGKMNSSANFREQMRRATQGRILFRNYTGVPQIVYVNGTAWNVTTGESYIDAPVGRVFTQMKYFDLSPVVYDHWKLENGSYVLPIDIR